MDARTMHIAEWMERNRVRFGTSGARGLVSDLTDEVCYGYTLAFLQYLEQTAELSGSGPVGVGGDLRPSTGRIMAAVARAVADRGYTAVGLGRLPSPALARWGLEHARPTVMVTGSHIPADRNGIKYTKRAGEILKPDEAGMKAQAIGLPAGLFGADGMFLAPQPAPPEADDASRLYLQRYRDFFPDGCLAGKRIGVYQHSAVGRELMVRILESLGAEVIPLGFSERFVAVDTEALEPEDIAAGRRWAAEHRLDAIVSTDGDSDRPLVADEHGKWLRGDVAGILCAAWLGAEAVVAPVSCNTAVERSGMFGRVIRTRIGSPWVIEAMQQARADGFGAVVGYEANGGFLIETPIRRWGRSLAPLPTRDAAIVHLAVLMSAIERDAPISALLADLPARFTHSDRLRDFPPETSRARLAELISGDEARDRASLESVFGADFGPVREIDTTDGVRVTFAADEVVHFRPSGNAPEFRCYSEAASEQRAREINRVALTIAERWR